MGMQRSDKLRRKWQASWDRQIHSFLESGPPSQKNFEMPVNITRRQSHGLAQLCPG